MEEKRRLLRIKTRWDTVRKICHAFLAIQGLFGEQTFLQTDTKFNEYERLRSLLQSAPSERTHTNLEFMAQELSLLKVFKEYEVNQKHLMEIAASSSIVVLPPGQFLFKQGDIGQYFYVVLLGVVDIQVLQETSGTNSGK